MSTKPEQKCLEGDDFSFVNVCLGGEEPGEPQKDFYASWVNKASGQHSDPGLLGATYLRKLYPNHSIVSTASYDLNVLSYPQITSKPLTTTTPLITELVFIPLARSLESVPGILIDQVKIGAFEAWWKSYEFLLYVVSYPTVFGTITQTYILHDGPEDPARLLLLSVGKWSHELHDELWVFNQGFWNKDQDLWREIQKADWNDVILKHDFKKKLQQDVNGFFSSKEVYKKLSIPWKRGLILYGPPGNGKTISLKAIMKTCSDNGFVPLYVRSFQSWKGEEGAMIDVFNLARQTAPSVLVLEDLDSLINDRNRSFFLNQLDGLEGNNGLLVIGTTNHFDRLHPGLSSRPSRFDRKFLFDDPDIEERVLYAQYWQKKLADNQDIDFPDSLLREVVNLTEQFSFAYLKEAFVATLVTMAGNAEPNATFSEILKDQIRDLRKQLDQKSFLRGHGYRITSHETVLPTARPICQHPGTGYPSLDTVPQSTTPADISTCRIYRTPFHHDDRYHNPQYPVPMQGNTQSVIFGSRPNQNYVPSTTRDATARLDRLFSGPQPQSDTQFSSFHTRSDTGELV